MHFGGSVKQFVSLVGSVKQFVSLVINTIFLARIRYEYFHQEGGFYYLRSALDTNHLS